MKHILIDGDSFELRTASSFPSDFFPPWNLSLELSDKPRVDSRVEIGIIKLTESPGGQVLVLNVVFPDHIHQRARVLELEHNLARARTLQRLLVEFFHSRQPSPRGQTIEVVQEIHRCFLIFEGKLVAMVSLCHSNA